MSVFVSSDFKLCGCHLQGVMEAIRISCAGYPTRKSFDEFVQRFSILDPKVLKWYFHPLYVFSSSGNIDECDRKCCPILVVQIIKLYLEMINNKHISAALMRLLLARGF
jgi:hypothetical protein